MDWTNKIGKTRKLPVHHHLGINAKKKNSGAFIGELKVSGKKREIQAIEVGSHYRGTKMLGKWSLWEQVK